MLNTAPGKTGGLLINKKGISISLVNAASPPGSIIQTSQTVKQTIMKYIIILVLLIAVVLNGLTAYQLFQHASYDLSSLMIYASYLSIVMSIYVLTVSRKKSLTH